MPFIDWQKGNDTIMQSEWISIKDKLPKAQRVVLVFTDSNRSFVGWVRENYECYKEVFRFIIDTRDDCAGLVTHWMPLPEKPKRELFEQGEYGICLKNARKAIYVGNKAMSNPCTLVKWLNSLPLKLDESKLNAET